MGRSDLMKRSNSCGEVCDALLGRKIEDAAQLPFIDGRCGAGVGGVVVGCDRIDRGRNLGRGRSCRGIAGVHCAIVRKCWRGRGRWGSWSGLFLAKVVLLLALGDAEDLVLIDGAESTVFGNQEAAVDGLANDGVARRAVKELFGAPLHGGKLSEAGV